MPCTSPYSSITNTVLVPEARNWSSSSMPVSDSGTYTAGCSSLVRSIGSSRSIWVKIFLALTMPRISSSPPRHTGKLE